MQLVMQSEFQHTQAGHTYWMASMHEYICFHSVMIMDMIFFSCSSIPSHHLCYAPYLSSPNTSIVLFILHT